MSAGLRGGAPQSLISFARTNARWLAAGGILTFSSAYGQTFFISIFAGEIMEAFDLSHGQWGGIYAFGTLASAIAMIFAGGLTDGVRVRTLGPIILMGLAGVCLALSALPWAWALPLIVFGLRFCGQGMMTHTAVTGLGRWFAGSRGRASAIISMGYVTAEAFLPFVFVGIMALVGWRLSWVVAALLALAAIPILRLALAQERQPGSEADQLEQTGMHARHWTRRAALSHWLFWVAALAVASPSTFITAYFFQQVHLTEVKDWPLSGFVALIPLFSGVALLMAFVFGAVADRFGTALVFPVIMLPGAAAFWVAATGQSLTAAALAFALLGIMGGGMSTIGGAFWPEYFGTRHLGAVRALGTSAMVLGSAIGPGLTGYLIDFGVDYQLQLKWISGYFLVQSGMLTAAFLIARQTLR